MTDNVALVQYSEIVKKIQAIHKKNSGIFERLKELEDTRERYERALKEEARDKGSMEDETIAVKVIDTYRKWYDFRIIEKFASTKELNLIKDEAIVVEVLRPEFETLVKDGKIDANVMQKAFREEKLTSKVIITEK